MSIADDTAALVARLPTEIWIGGRWRESASSATFAVENPATGTPIADVADAGPADALAAAEAADNAQQSWSEVAPRDRSETLRLAWSTIIDRADEFALLISAEMGKSLEEAHAEVVYGAEFFRWYAEEAPRIYGRYSMSPTGDGRIVTMRFPVGPCLLITPWNFPLAMATRKVAPALAAGCATVVKPAEQTPLTTLLLAEVLHSCGLPPGVFNVLPTSAPEATVGALIESAKFRKLSFTGSTAVGRLLMKQSADHVMRVSMELGGNAPFLVFEDADMDAAVSGAILAKTRNMGQSCVAANRFIVHESVAEAFCQRLVTALRGLKVGPASDPDNDIGPMIDEASRGAAHALVEEAVALGAEVRLGGSVPNGSGYFYAPTVLSGAPRTARLWREEIFGPIASVTTFSSEEEAIARANDTEYGLVGYVYTENISRAIRVLERLEVGMVGLNRGLVSNPSAPFGGTKESGIGREGGSEGLDEYLETRYIAVEV